MPEINQPAPLFTLPDLDGRPVALEDLRGRIVVVIFWSAECPWAARADGLIREWRQAWGSAAAVIMIAANANETADQLRQAAAERDLDCVLVDADHRAADPYQAQTTPHAFVIDENGLLRYQGGVDDVTFRQRAPTRFYLREAVDALLAGATPPLSDTPPYGCTIVRF